MRRMSKREIGFRFDLIRDTRVKIDRLEHGHAVAMLEGVECRLDIPRSERRDLAKSEVVRAVLSDYPRSNGEGSPPRGTRPDKNDWFAKIVRVSNSRIRLRSSGFDRESLTRRYEAFALRHPVGSMVDALVTIGPRNRIRLRIDDGLQCRITRVDCADPWPRRPRADPGTVHLPARVEVIVRRVIPEGRMVSVSIHGYPQDGKYCNAAAGYRSTYDARSGMFQLMPWERNTGA